MALSRSMKELLTKVSEQRRGVQQDQGGSFSFATDGRSKPGFSVSPGTKKPEPPRAFGSMRGMTDRGRGPGRNLR